MAGGQASGGIVSDGRPLRPVLADASPVRGRCVVVPIYRWTEARGASGVAGVGV